MAGTFTISTIPAYLTARTLQYTAWQLRNFMDGDPPGPGVADYESFRVKQRGAGANLSADVGNTSLNQAWVRGTTRDGLGLWRADNVSYADPTTNTFLAQINTGLIFSANDPTNARIDQVFLRILDQQHDGGGSNLLQIQVVDGTATGGATLDNRTGVGAVPANSILLADVLMPGGGASQVLTANIRDRRPRCLRWDSGIAGSTPLTVPTSQFDFAPGIRKDDFTLTTMPTLAQAAVQVYLPNRIAAATRIRWTYKQGGTAAIGNYVIGIYDSSGRLVRDTGTVAYTGALGTFQNRSETITAATFEPGIYYVLFGHNFSAGSATAISAFYVATAGTTAVASQFVASGTGSATAPTTILGFTDLLVGNAAAFAVPHIALSVG